MEDVTCNYCKHEFDVELDDEEPNSLFAYDCPNCEKTLMIMYELDCRFHSYEAPCKNGGEHLYEDMCGAPSWYFAGKKRCKYCKTELEK